MLHILLCSVFPLLIALLLRLPLAAQPYAGIWSNTSMDHMHHGHEMIRRPSSGHEAALRSVQKPPSKPWRAGGGGLAAPAPTPPKVYRVEPREFRDLVQRLTGAAPAARQQQQQRAALAPAQPVAVGAGVEEVAVAGQTYAPAPWCTFFPLMAPAAMHLGLDGHQLI